MKLETVWAVICKLVIGSVFYLLSRMIMKTCSEPMGSFDYIDAAGKPKNKNCPIGETSFGKGIFLMTIGWAAMMPALGYFFVFQKRKAPSSAYGARAMTLVLLPSATDMVSTALSTFGLPLLSLSLAFIFKGGRVVFSALLTLCILKRRLHGYHWLSIGLCVIGLVIAASSQLLSEPSSVDGVFLVLGSELFKGLRVVLEERLMKNESFEPTFLVGVEGLFGTIVFASTLFVVWLGVKGDDHGSFENLEDTLYRISQSESLTILFCLFPLITCVVSIASAVVTRNLSAVHNGLISVIRVGILWLVELTLFYSLQSSLGKQLGEPWNEYSWLKLLGFAIVVLSSLIYDEDIKLKWFFNYDHLKPVDQQVKVAEEAHQTGAVYS